MHPAETAADPIVTVRGLSKIYWTGRFDRLRLALACLRRAAPPVPRQGEGQGALHDISFTVPRGQTVGIVGRNGSGKSTLLQILAGTLAATGGEIRVVGRTSALLELGAGFNPEFSGRENIFLNGAVMGLGREEIEARLDSIIAFADLGPQIDQPVLTYSSGMVVRLAFSIAISVEPELLIVDEALAVGDEAFQRKCYARIESFTRNGGTLLFVSHSAPTILQLCQHMLLLDQGTLLWQGSPKHGITLYQRLIHAPRDRQPAIRAAIQAAGATDPETALAGTLAASRVVTDSPTNTAPEESPEGEALFDPDLVPPSRVDYAPRGAVITDARLETLDGERINLLRRRGRYRYCFEVAFTEPGFAVAAQMIIKLTTGLGLAGAVTNERSLAGDQIAAGTRLRVAMEFQCLLFAGTYFINAAVTGDLEGERGYLHRIIDAVMFKVLPDTDPTESAGLIDFFVEPSVTVIAPQEELPVDPQGGGP